MQITHCADRPLCRSPLRQRRRNITCAAPEPFHETNLTRFIALDDCSDFRPIFVNPNRSFVSRKRANCVVGQVGWDLRERRRFRDVFACTSDLAPTELMLAFLEIVSPHCCATVRDMGECSRQDTT